MIKIGDRVTVNGYIGVNRVRRVTAVRVAARCECRYLAQLDGGPEWWPGNLLEIKQNGPVSEICYQDGQPVMARPVMDVEGRE